MPSGLILPRAGQASQGSSSPYALWVGMLAGMKYTPSLVFLSILLFQAPADARFIDEAQTLRVNGRVYNRMAMAVEDAADNTRFQTPYNSWRSSIWMNVRLWSILNELYGV